MLNKEWGSKSNEKLPHLFIPSKTAALVPEFAVEDLPFSGSATFVPAFAVKNLNTLVMAICITLGIETPCKK